MESKQENPEENKTKTMSDTTRSGYQIFVMSFLVAILTLQMVDVLSENQPGQNFAESETTRYQTKINTEGQATPPKHNKSTSINYIQASNLGHGIYDQRYNTVRVSSDYCLEMTGHSMQPRIFKGNTVCLEDIDTEKEGLQVQDGDIVAYRYPNTTGLVTVHTVRSTYEGNEYDVVVQGDNNKYYEEIKEEWIRGRVTTIIQS